MERHSVGIRRRRRRLTTLMSRLDQRVRAVELRPISLLTSDQVNAAVELGETTAGPESLVSANAPWQFRKIQDAYLYPKALTGTEDRVEIYLESDLNLSVGDRIEVSGIHGATDLDIDVTSDNFTVAYVDTPPWDGRQVGSGSNQITKHSPEDDQLTGVTITNTYSFKPETLAPQTLSSETRLQTRRKVDTYSITGTAVTLTMNANHKFQEGDVIFVDIFSEDSRAYGLDGLFYVTAVTDDTIEYTLDAGVDTPTGDVDVSTADVYVFPVAREWAQYGSTWIDSSTNQVYWWNGIRLVEYTPGAVEGDGDPPSAPTGLSASFEMGYGPNGGNVAVIRATLSWTAPTTSESGAELTDLLSYRIQYQLDPSGSWITLPDISDPSLTSFTFGELFTFEKSTPSTTKTYNFRVYAIDSGGEVSGAATASADTPEAPATNIGTVKPVLSNDPPYLGTVTIYWNGTVKDALGTTQSNPEGMYYVEFHRSTSATFTASDSTLIGTVAAVPNAKFVDGSLSNAYGTTFYYVAVIVDGNGTRSVQSDPPLAVTAQSSVDVAAIQGIIDAAGIVPGTIVTGEEIIGLNITGQLIRGVEINAGIIEANSITADKIDVGNVTAQIVDSRLFTSRTVTGTNPPTYTGAGVTFDDTGLYAYGTDGVPTFQINASTGTVTIGNYVKTNDLAPYVTGSELTTTLSSYATLSSLGLYITASDASTTYLSKSTASSTYLSQTSASETYVTQLSAGELYIAKGNAAQDINDNSTTISGGKITTNSINVNRLVAGTLTGFRIQTSDTGQRVVVSEQTNSLAFINDDNVICGRIAAGGGGNQFFFDNESATGIYTFALDSSAILSINSSGIALSPGKTFNSSLRVTIGGIISDTNITADNLKGTGTRNVNSTSGGILTNSTSSLRYKQDIAPLNISYDELMALEPKTFRRIDEVAEYGDLAPTYGGMIAEDLAGTSLDNFVFYDPDGEGGVRPEGIHYSEFTAALLYGLKTQNDMIASLEARIATLEGN